jgi:beta-phosphoglucomutase-like phosphatase (HAD superfamily)
MLPPFHVVVFDMDGLVLDSEPTFQRAWQYAAAELGFTLDDASCRSFSGRQYTDIEAAIMKRFGPGFPLQAFKELSADCWRGHVEAFGIPVKPGFEWLVELLNRRQIPFCLATNSDRSNTLECLRLAGIPDCFPEIVSRDDVARAKPAPDLFLEAAKRLHAAPGNCLVLEDSAIGIHAARRAGTIPLLITRQPHVVERAADRPAVVLPSLLEVVRLLENCRKHS